MDYLGGTRRVLHVRQFEGPVPVLDIGCLPRLFHILSYPGPAIRIGRVIGLARRRMRLPRL